MDDEHMLLGMLHNRKNTGSKDLFHYKRAIAIDSNQPDPYFNLGLEVDIKINTINEKNCNVFNCGKKPEKVCKKEEVK